MEGVDIGRGGLRGSEGRDMVNKGEAEGKG